MSLTLSIGLVAATTTPFFKTMRNSLEGIRADREFVVETTLIDAEGLRDVIDAARGLADTKTARAAESILAARSGRFDKPIPNFKAFKGSLEAFLSHGCINGWIFTTGEDGKFYPELVTSVTYDPGDDGRGKPNPKVRVHTVIYGVYQANHSFKYGVTQKTHSFYPHSVANRRITDILAAEGIYKETQELIGDHATSLEQHRNLTQNAFAQQFRLSGRAIQYEVEHYQRRGTVMSARRVIHDLESREFGARPESVESFLFKADEKSDGLAQVPEHPVIKVFDLRAHEFLWVHADNLTPYVYDKSLRDKLVLPSTHRDLLDVLTTDIGAFVDDFIEGKSAGNVILCKGVPGVGKTLTAEVYAELIERPLYSIHSGELGTTPEAIEKNLRVIFQRGKRWGCVLLLDEADVFVVRRGSSIEQNAIVAEFLRTLEYFDGLLFMTTNRPDDIDEAIISRCAAVIDYAPPCPDDTAAIWRVMAAQHQVQLSGELIAELVLLFPGIAPRDIKMLLRLVLRVASVSGESLTAQTFRRCAMFRAIKMSTE